MKVAFLGAGEYGTALGEVAESNGHEVKYYDPVKLPKVKIEEVLEGAEAVVYVAPAQAYKELLPKLDVSVPLILASKGFLSLKPFADFKHFSALGGAVFAEDIKEKAMDKPLALTASSELAEQLFTTDFLTIEYTDDTKGIVLCGALKNIYAIGAGMMPMEEWKPYFREVYEEMGMFLEKNGCHFETVLLSCGLMDFLVSTVGGGRNFEYGREVAEHPKSKIEPAGTVEGVAAIKLMDEFTDLKVPRRAVRFKEIVEKVRGATE